jgi:hypothetical protein
MRFFDNQCETAFSEAAMAWAAHRSEARRWGLAWGLLVALLSAPAVAQPEEADHQLLGLEAHGFASQGFLISTGNEYLVTDSKRGSFQLSEVGLNFSRDLTDRLRFGVQFFAQNFGAAGNYTPRVDWFYLDYHARDWLGLRAGRLKIPYGLYNEVNDVDSARVPVLLPQSLYPLQARSFLFAETGGELYGFVRLHGAGALDYRLYGGTIYIDPGLVVPVGSPVQLKLNVPWAMGGRLLWETPLRGLRVGASVLRLRVDSVAYFGMGMSAGIKNDSLLQAYSAEYTVWALTFTAEYTRGHSKQVSVLPGAILDNTGDGGYVMLNWAATSWLQPGAYYALSFLDVGNRHGPSHRQHDLTFTLRFDLNRFWLLKLEGHYMEGSAGLVNPLRIEPPPANPARHWGVFLVKTTVYF